MMPSATAALVACTASSMRCLRSLASISVAAPTLITATPPASLASRSCSFSRSQSESVVSMSCRSCAARSATASADPPPSTIVVSSLVTVTRRAVPSTSRPTSDSLSPTSADTTSAPVTIARSWMNALRRSPKNGDLTAATVNVLRIALTTRVDSASPSTSSATISSGFFGLEHLLQQRQQVGQRGDLLPDQQDVGVLQNGLAGLRIGGEVGRDVALVELHAVGVLELGGQRRSAPRRRRRRRRRPSPAPRRAGRRSARRGRRWCRPGRWPRGRRRPGSPTR